MSDEKGASTSPDPSNDDDVEALRDELETLRTDLLAQEHRPLSLVRNILDHGIGSATPIERKRRTAVWLAALWSFFGPVMVVGGSATVGSFLMLQVAWDQKYWAERQTRAVVEQNRFLRDTLVAQQSANEQARQANDTAAARDAVARHAELIGVLYDRQVCSTERCPFVASDRARRDAFLALVNLGEREFRGVVLRGMDLSALATTPPSSMRGWHPTRPQPAAYVACVVEHGGDDQARRETCVRTPVGPAAGHNGLILDGADLRDVTMRGLHLEGASFVGANLDGQPERYTLRARRFRRRLPASDGLQRDNCRRRQLPPRAARRRQLRAKFGHRGISCRRSS